MDLRHLHRLHASLPALVSGRRQPRSLPPRFDSDTAQVEALLAGLARKRRSRSKILSVSLVLLVGGGLAFCVYALALSAWPLLAIGLMIACTGLLTAYRRSVRHERSHVLRQLTGYDDTRAVGPLTGALFSRNRALRKAACIALTRLLPRLQASDSVLLTPAHHANLRRCLTLSHARRLPEFVYALLKALEQVGEAGALPGVRELATMPTRTAAQQRVQQAARDCLPYLEARIASARVRQSLLRPCEMPVEISVAIPIETSDALLNSVLAPAVVMLSEPQTLRRDEP